MRFTLFLLLLFVFFLSFSPLSAQTEVRGEVEGEWDIEGSPYIVRADIILRNNDELIIHPGVNVEFNGEYTFNIYGALTCDGLENQPILFTAGANEDFWRSIRILRNDHPISITYTIIESSEVIGRYNNRDSRGAALYAEDCEDITFSHNEVRKCRGTGEGAVTFYRCGGTFDNNHIHDTETFTEIVWFDGADMYIGHNLVEDNFSDHGAGIIVELTSQIVEHNVIRNNNSTVMAWGAGLYFVNNSHCRVRNNLIYGNFHGGVYVGVNSEPREFVNNVIYGNPEGPAITMYGGSDLEIKNCIIWEHDDPIWYVDNEDRVSVDYSVVDEREYENMDVFEGMLSVDPDFVNPEQGDFRLQATSFCIDAGDPHIRPDPDETRADMGAIYHDHEGRFGEIEVDPLGVDVDPDQDEYVINISNWGDFPVWYHAQCNERWIEIEERSGVLEPDADADFFYTILRDRLPDEFAEADITFRTSDPENQEIVFIVTYDHVEMESMEIDLHEGWQMISTNVSPVDDYWENENGPDVISLFEQLQHGRNHDVRLFKDELGRFYSTEFNFCNIPYWNLTEGYLICMNNDAFVEWEGEEIGEDADIPISAGWNLIAYYPDYRLSANEPDFYVLSPILDDVVIAKNDLGQFMIPAWNFSNMEPWHRGEGYQIEVSRNVTLNYPEPRDIVFEAKRDDKFDVSGYVTITDNNMSMLLSSTDLFPDFQIRAYNSNGKMIGIGIVNRDKRCGMALWGDQAETTEIEGLLIGEIPQYTVFDGRDEFPAQVDLEFGEKSFNPNKYACGNIFWTPEPIVKEYRFSKPYPNPYNAETCLEYSIPQEGLVKIELFDSSGRNVKQVLYKLQRTGSYRVSVDSSDLPSGNYTLVFSHNQMQRSWSVTSLK